MITQEAFSRLSSDVRSAEFTRVADGARWDALVLDRDMATPFHSWVFLQSFARRWGLDFVPLAAHVEGRIIGGVPLLVRSRFGLRWVNDLIMFGYLGPAVDAEHLPAVLEGLGADHRITTMRERHEARVPLAEAPDVAGWRRRPAGTFVVPLRGRTVDELAAAASKSFRQSSRRSLRHGLTVRAASEAEIEIELPRLMHDSYRRQGLVEPYAADTYGRVWRHFAARGAAHATTVSHGDRTVAMALTLIAGDTAYGWVTASDPDYRRAEPSMAAQRAEVLAAHEAGLRQYDLIGGSTAGIAAFKRSLGGVERAHVVYDRGRRTVSGPR